MIRPRTSEPRDKQFNLSLTASELASIQQRAEAVGMRPVHFGRALLLDENRNINSVKNEIGGNVERLIYAQLVRLGNNLNQLVRHLHRTGEPLPTDLTPLLTDIRQIMARGGGDDR
jgi:hypothetical protein